MIFKKACFPLFFILLFFIFRCSDFTVDAKSSQFNLEEFDQSWEFVNAVYPYFGLKDIEWENVYNNYKPIAAGSKGDEILSILLDMLGELKDGHVYIKTAGGHKIYAYIPPRRIRDQLAYSPLVVRNYFNTDLRVTAPGGMEYGLTKENIGYIYIASFGSGLNFRGSFQAAMNYTQSAEGLIIDIRQNMGGDGVNANYVVSRFIDESLICQDSYVLGEKTDSSSIQPSEENRYLKPVVVLINGVCYSAAESCAEMMKQIDHVTVIGDTTGGGSAGYYGTVFPASGDLNLASGFTVHVGTMDIRRYDNLPFEDIGICPDILVRQSESDISDGHDPQLEAAFDFLR